MTQQIPVEAPEGTHTHQAPSGRRSVIAQFDYQTSLRPGSIALEVNGKTFSYAAVREQANRIAQFLETEGIGTEDVVAICLNRTENLPIAILGVLMAGAAYLPLNPADPPFRLAQVTSHANARLTITDSRSKSNVAESVPRLVVLDELLTQESHRQAEGMEDAHRFVERPVAADADLAYVIYTSGTTGVPKGVAVTHGSLINMTEDIASRLGFDHYGGWLAVAPVSFDMAVMDFLLPLSQGGRLILATEQQARIGSFLKRLVTQSKPTVMQGTPLTWRILIESGWSGSANFTVLSGGDRLDRELADKLLARSASVWNFYGPTETTVYSTAEKLDVGPAAITIGTPLANTEIYILDEERRPVARGEIGEIWIGGKGLARGYINDLPLTQKFFINVPLPTQEFVRLYRTGDLGRWNELGKLECLGRIDHQVKINGFRIELAEIEKVLENHPLLAEAAAFGVEDGSSQKRLYAVVVSKAGETVTKALLVDHVARYLPKYMIPERFWVLDRLPSTHHGKRDVKSLKALTQTQQDLAV